MRLITLFVASILMSACATSPQTAAPPAPAAVPAAAPAASAAPAAQPGVAVALPSIPAADDFKPPPGYRTLKRGDQTIYCKSFKPIGSSVPQTSCLTKEQVQEAERRNQQDRDDMYKRQGQCGTGGCGGS